MRTDSTLVKFIISSVGKIGLVSSVLLGGVSLKHTLRVILRNGARLNFLIAVKTAQTDVTGVKRLHIYITVTTRVTNSNQIVLNHG
jgi:hypothetical protein